MLDTDLCALRDKYERILRLRLLHVRAREEAAFSEPDPRAAMAELAREFPGALRELDELPLDVIRERVGALAAAENDATAAAPWMHAQVRFHRLARGALGVKRWLGGRPLTPELEASFARALPRLPNADDVSVWASSLAAVAKPPRGRVLDLVYARLADELG
ncbi:MAG TPA: hypothetical protein VLT33_02510, partial [Labilithrix sp.]|nr:hypothetical protein [Labilithrix sp.]